MTTPHGIFYGNRGVSHVIAEYVERSATWLTAPIYLVGAKRLSLSYYANNPTGGDNIIVTPYGKDIATAGYGSVIIGDWHVLCSGSEMDPDNPGCMFWSAEFEDRNLASSATLVHRQCILPPVIRLRFDHRSGPLVGTYSATLHIT